jgi:hypothetical protein
VSQNRVECFPQASPNRKLAFVLHQDAEQPCVWCALDARRRFRYMRPRDRNPFQELPRFSRNPNNYNNLGNLLFARQPTQDASRDRVRAQFCHSASQATPPTTYVLSNPTKQSVYGSRKPAGAVAAIAVLREPNRTITSGRPMGRRAGDPGIRNSLSFSRTIPNSR